MVSLVELAKRTRVIEVCIGDKNIEVRPSHCSPPNLLQVAIQHYEAKLLTKAVAEYRKNNPSPSSSPSFAASQLAATNSTTTSPLRRNRELSVTTTPRVQELSEDALSSSPLDENSVWQLASYNNSNLLDQQQQEMGGGGGGGGGTPNRPGVIGGVSRSRGQSRDSDERSTDGKANVDNNFAVRDEEGEVADEDWFVGPSVDFVLFVASGDDLTDEDYFEAMAPPPFDLDEFITFANETENVDDLKFEEEEEEDENGDYKYGAAVNEDERTAEGSIGARESRTTAAFATTTAPTTATCVTSEMTLEMTSEMTSTSLQREVSSGDDGDGGGGDLALMTSGVTSGEAGNAGESSPLLTKSEILRLSSESVGRNSIDGLCGGGTGSLASHCSEVSSTSPLRPVPLSRPSSSSSLFIPAISKTTPTTDLHGMAPTPTPMTTTTATTTVATTTKATTASGGKQGSSGGVGKVEAAAALAAKKKDAYARQVLDKTKRQTLTHSLFIRTFCFDTLLFRHFNHCCSGC
jgi:hypothetical protein